MRCRHRVRGAALLLVRGGSEPVEVKQGDTIPGTRLLVVLGWWIWL